MASSFEAENVGSYKMNFREPHVELEPLAEEVAVIDKALDHLVEQGILSGKDYDGDLFLKFRAAVRENFDIPWTAISPRMQRLIYAINAICRPEVMVAVGIFCGNTFISNAGASVGPGACYEPKRVVGIEIKEDEAGRARKNVATIDTNGIVEIVAADGIPWLQECKDPIGLLYLDADGTGGRGKSIYLDMVQAALHLLEPGSIVLAHNSVNQAKDLGDYLAYMRAGDTFRNSANMIVDNEGLEVSLR